MSDAQWGQGRPGDGPRDPRNDPHGDVPAPGPHGPGSTMVLDPPQAPPGAPVATGPAPRPKRVGIVVAALLAGVVGGAAGFGGAYALLDSPSAPALTSSPSSGSTAQAPAGSIAAAAAAATPSTVDVRVNLGNGTAEGSGVVLTADGYVLTNNHVVDGASGTITVTLSDGTRHTATVVGTSPSYDLAVLRLEGVAGLTPATLGRSSDVTVGQQVVAIGSPQGLAGTVTTGIVSALDRTVEVSESGSGGSAVVYNGLQTDAPINQGNSGGPLVNLDGQVVGINSAIATAGSSETGSIGLGFAIPVDQAKRVAQEIIDTGHATKPVLGVQGQVTSSRSGATEGDGATIGAVQAGSPAAAAGLQAGDVVTKVGDATVSDFSDLVARIGAHAPGESVPLTVTSVGGSPRTVQVTLGSTTDDSATTNAAPSSSESPIPVLPFPR